MVILFTILEGIMGMRVRRLIKKLILQHIQKTYFQNKKRGRSKVMAPTSHRAQVGTRINHFGF